MLGLWILCRGGVLRDQLGGDTKEHPGVLEMFSILVWVMVIWGYAYVNVYPAVHLRSCTAVRASYILREREKEKSQNLRLTPLRVLWPLALAKPIHRAKYGTRCRGDCVGEMKKHSAVCKVLGTGLVLNNRLQISSLLLEKIPLPIW